MKCWRAQSTALADDAASIWRESNNLEAIRGRTELRWQRIFEPALTLEYKFWDVISGILAMLVLGEWLK